jgi:hypothetical protein
MQPTNRPGTSLCEVMFALVLLATTAAWGLQAAAQAERAFGDLRRRQAALHRAERAIADFNALPCDSLSISRTIVEPRWRIEATRDHNGLAYSDDIQLTTNSADTVRLHQGGWCD